MCKETIIRPLEPSRPWADAGCDVYTDGATMRFEYAGGINANGDGADVIAREVVELAGRDEIAGSRELELDAQTLTVAEAFRLAAALALEAAAVDERAPQPDALTLDRVANHFETWARGTVQGVLRGGYIAGTKRDGRLEGVMIHE